MVGAFTRSASHRLNCFLCTVSNSLATLKEPPLFAFAFLFSFCFLWAFFVKETPSFKPFKKYQKTLVENNLQL